MPQHTLFTRCCCPLIGGEEPTRNTGSCSQILSENKKKKAQWAVDALQNQQSPCAPAILSERSTPLLLLLLPWPPNWQTRVSSISSVDGNYRRLCSNTLVLYWSLSTGAATEPAAPSATIKLTEGGEEKKASSNILDLYVLGGRSWGWNSGVQDKWKGEKKIVKCNDQRKAERGNFVFHHFKEKGNESSPSPAIKVSHLIVSVLHFFFKRKLGGKSRDSVGMVQVYFETAGRMVSESLYPCNNVFPLSKHRYPWCTTLCWD